MPDSPEASVPLDLSTTSSSTVETPAATEDAAPAAVFSLPADPAEEVCLDEGDTNEPEEHQPQPQLRPSNSETDSAESEQTTTTAALPKQQQNHPQEWGPLFEYHWPLGSTADSFVLQEQLSDLLDVKSFRRKHPELPGRRALEADERRHLLGLGVISEALEELGLTAVPTAVALELVQRDYPDKLELLTGQLQERRRQQLLQRQSSTASANNAAAATTSTTATAASSSSTSAADAAAAHAAARRRAYQRAVKSAGTFNRQLLAARPAGAVCTQTLQLLLPQRRVPQPPQQEQQNTAYPVAILPGQFAERCQHADSTGGGGHQLNYLPLTRCLFSLPRRPALPPVRLDNSVKCSLCQLDCPSWEVLECKECHNKGHTACLQLPDNMLQAARAYAWQCMECKRCQECLDAGHEDRMMFCDACDRGYHTFCVGLVDIPQGHWKCPVCVGPVAAAAAETPPVTTKSRGGKRRASTTLELSAKG